MPHARRTGSFVALSTGLVTLALLAGCTPTTPSGPSETITQEQIDKAMSTPTTIDFWTWMPNAEQYVAIFEKKYPEITVNLSNVGQGLDQYTKLRTALAAGDAPDVAGIEYPFLAGFQQDLLDLTPYGAGDMKDLFVSTAWDQVVLDDKIVAMPQDFGPMGAVWRQDLLDQAGVEIPTTWDEFATAAATVKEKTGSYLTTVGSNLGPWFISLLWQAGVEPFSYDGEETIGVDLTSDEALDVANYWNDLIQADLVGVEPQFTNEWFQAMNDGTYAGWLTAAWGPVYMESSLADTAGLWTASALPQDDPANPASSYWGGTSIAVLATSDDAIVSSEFAKFWTSDVETSEALAANFAFVPLISTQESTDFIEAKSDFFNGQQVHKLFGEIADTVVNPSFQWLPFNDYVSSTYNDTVGAAMVNKTDLSAAMQEWQDLLVEYGEQQGYTVNP
jgi:multiple sugar transport system substrate-binding protein